MIRRLCSLTDSNVKLLLWMQQNTQDTKAESVADTTTVEITTTTGRDGTMTDLMIDTDMMMTEDTETMMMIDTDMTDTMIIDTGMEILESGRIHVESK